MDCASLVNQLGGLNKVDILWLENLNEKKYQYVLINLSNKNNKQINFIYVVISTILNQQR